METAAVSSWHAHETLYRAFPENKQTNTARNKSSIQDTLFPYFPPELFKGFAKPMAAIAVTPTYLFSVTECS